MLVSGNRCTEVGVLLPQSHHPTHHPPPSPSTSNPPANPPANRPSCHTPRSTKFMQQLLTQCWPLVGNLSWPTVDVRDVAAVHTLAAFTPRAHGRWGGVAHRQAL